MRRVGGHGPYHRARGGALRNCLVVLLVAGGTFLLVNWMRRGLGGAARGLPNSQVLRAQVGSVEEGGGEGSSVRGGGAAPQAPSPVAAAAEAAVVAPPLPSSPPPAAPSASGTPASTASASAAGTPSGSPSRPPPPAATPSGSPSRPPQSPSSSGSRAPPASPTASLSAAGTPSGSPAPPSPSPAAPLQAGVGMGCFSDARAPGRTRLAKAAVFTCSALQSVLTHAGPQAWAGDAAAGGVPGVMAPWVAAGFTPVVVMDCDAGGAGGATDRKSVV